MQLELARRREPGHLAQRKGREVEVGGIDAEGRDGGLPRIVAERNVPARFAAISLQREPERGPAQDQRQDVRADHRALESQLRRVAAARGREAHANVSGPYRGQPSGAGAADGDVRARPPRLHLDAASEQIVGERQHQEDEEGEHARSGEDQPARDRMAVEERGQERHVGWHQDPCQALTVRETSSVSLFS